MSESMFLALLTMLASVSGSMGAVWLQSKKWREGDKPASAAGTADVITGTSLELVAGLRAEMTIIRGELATVKTENFMLREKMTELEDVKDWAERLVHQVQSLGAEPVKMRVRTVRTNE